MTVCKIYFTFYKQRNKKMILRLTRVYIAEGRRMNRILFDLTSIGFVLNGLIPGSFTPPSPLGLTLASPAYRAGASYQPVVRNNGGRGLGYL